MSIQDLIAGLDKICPPALKPEVSVRGEALSSVYWHRKQWAVTEDGLECRDGTYFIAKRRLWEDENQWGWVLQLQEKSWVDIEDFIICLAVARIKHSDYAPA